MDFNCSEELQISVKLSDRSGLDFRPFRITDRGTRRLNHSDIHRGLAAYFPWGEKAAAALDAVLVEAELLLQEALRDLNTRKTRKR
jgi:hypothetical protein